MFFWSMETFATKDFVLSGFSEFQQSMTLDRLLMQRDNLMNVERNIRVWLYNHPNDSMALQDLDGVRKQLFDIDRQIKELTTPRR